MSDRTNKQKLITLHVDEELFSATETARKRVNRSQWIRDAILEKLEREGYQLAEEAALPPDRAQDKDRARIWKAETLRKTDSQDTPPSSTTVKYPKPGRGVKKKHDP